jgi:hypothetical protein
VPFPDNGRSADRLVPAWQHLEIGDRVLDGAPDKHCALALRRYGRWPEIDDSADSRVLIGTQPSRPSLPRHQSQPLVRSSATTSSRSPVAEPRREADENARPRHPAIVAHAQRLVIGQKPVPFIWRRSRAHGPTLTRARDACFGRQAR